MDFSQALEQIKQGYKVRRDGWNGKGMFLFLANSQWFGYCEKPLNLADFIAVQATDSKIYPWLASQQDLLATNWEVLKTRASKEELNRLKGEVKSSIYKSDEA